MAFLSNDKFSDFIGIPIAEVIKKTNNLCMKSTWWVEINS